MKEPGPIYSPQQALGGHREILGFRGKNGISVIVIPRDVANDLIKKNHYSGTYVNNSYIHLGVYMNNDIVGALQYGYALNPNSGANIVPGTQNDEYLELNRMWLSDSAPPNSESTAISLSIKYIRNVYKRVRFIQSFADERCGANGVVYQAANFFYYGYHESEFVEYEGKTYHKIAATTLTGKGGAISHVLVPKWKNGELSKTSYKQFRYIYFIQEKYKSQCTLKQMPFPKRHDPI